MIKNHLDTLEEFEHTDTDGISIIIKNAIQFVKKYTIKMPKKLKKNRINFFAKQR